MAGWKCGNEYVICSSTHTLILHFMFSSTVIFFWMSQIYNKFWINNPIIVLRFMVLHSFCLQKTILLQKFTVNSMRFMASILWVNVRLDIGVTYLKKYKQMPIIKNIVASQGDDKWFGGNSESKRLWKSVKQLLSFKLHFLKFTMLTCSGNWNDKLGCKELCTRYVSKIV